MHTREQLLKDKELQTLPNNGTSCCMNRLTMQVLCSYFSEVEIPKRISVTFSITLWVDLLPEDSITIYIRFPRKSFRVSASCEPRAGEVSLKSNFSLQVLKLSSNFWCTDIPHAYFAAVREERRRLLLAEVLNVDDRVYDQQAQRDKCFITGIILQFKFSNFCDHAQHMVIFTPIIWLDAFLHLSYKAASLNIKRCPVV